MPLSPAGAPGWPGDPQAATDSVIMTLASAKLHRLDTDVLHLWRALAPLLQRDSLTPNRFGESSSASNGRRWDLPPQRQPPACGSPPPVTRPGISSPAEVSQDGLLSRLDGCTQETSEGARDEGFGGRSDRRDGAPAGAAAGREPGTRSTA